MPRPAGLAVVGDPPVAERAIAMEIRTLPEGERLRTTIIPRGTVIRWEEGVSANRHRVLGDDGRCALDVDLPPEQTTFLRLVHDGTSCNFAIAEDGVAIESGQVSVIVSIQPWEDLVVEAVSQDTPAQPVPDGIPPDEGGLAQVGPLYPGRYEIRLRRGEHVLERRLVEIEAGGPPGHQVELVMDGRPD